MQDAKPPAAEDLAAFREACESRFAQFASDHLDNARKYHRFPEPDTVAPLVQAGLQQVLDGLFNPARYPHGISTEAIVREARERLPLDLFRILSPQRDALIVRGKHNHLGGALSVEDIDRSMVLRADELVQHMQEAAAEMGVAVDLPHWSTQRPAYAHALTPSHIAWSGEEASVAWLKKYDDELSRSGPRER